MIKWILNLFKRKKKTREPTLVAPKKDSPKKESFELKEGMIGIDISHHNKVTDMQKVVDGVDFIYMKATEGESFVSRVYDERARQLNQMDIPWGAYHYYRTGKDPKKQLAHFLSYIDVNSGLPPVLDVESINNNFKPNVHTAEILDILNGLEKATGIVPILYTNYYFCKDHIKPDESFLKYPLWIAWYRKDFNGVKIPKPWSNPKLWQFTSSGSINGIEGRVDINKVII